MANDKPVVATIPLLVGVKDGKPIFEELPLVAVPCYGAANCNK